MKTKHTPGPWMLTDENKARRVIKGEGSRPRTVCIVEDWTTEPDARLIAAAPALLEALESVVDGILEDEDMAGYTEAAGKAYAAIKAAKGEP